MDEELPAVHFGDATAPLPNWREAPDTEVDPDDTLLAETPPDVVMMLGFDPRELATHEELPVRKRNFRCDDPELRKVSDAAERACAVTVLAALEAMRDEVINQLAKADPPDLPFTSAHKLIEITAHTGPMATSSADKAARKIAPVAADAAVFDVVSKNAIAYAQSRAAALVTAIPETTRKMLRSTLTQSVEEGWSAGQLRQELKDDYAFSNDRALTIARTEMAFAEEGGAYQGYLTLRDKYDLTLTKTWLPDAEACPICVANGDQDELDFDDVFDSGDDSPPAHPNCRCSMSVRAANGDEEDTGS